MKTTFFTLLFAMSISLGMGQVITQAKTNSAVWVWSIQGQATYQEDGFKMARPLPEGQMLTTQADVWVSEGSHVILLYNGTSTSLGTGAHSISDLLSGPVEDAASGFGLGVPPPPPPSDGPSGRGNDGSGFGQGVTPPPAPSGRTSGQGNDGSGFGSGDDSVPPTPVTNGGGSRSDLGDGVVPMPDEDFLKWVYRDRDDGGSGFGQGVPPPPPLGGPSGRGNDGSGFGQGIDPAPAPSGRTSGRGDEGSGFGQGVAPAPAPSGRTSGRGDEGSGFGQGVAPAPAPSGRTSGRGDEGSGFGDGVTPDPDMGQRQPADRAKDGTGHSPIKVVLFDGGYDGNVTPGPVFYRWSQPGDHQTCQFKITSKATPANPIFLTNTVQSGITVDLGELNLKPGTEYIATIRLTDGEVAPGGRVSFTVVGPEVQLLALEKATNNALYSSGSAAHQSLLKALELEEAGLLSAATANYQKAFRLNPYSQLVQAMIFTYKKKYGLIRLD